MKNTWYRMLIATLTPMKSLFYHHRPSSCIHMTSSSNIVYCACNGQLGQQSFAHAWRNKNPNQIRKKKLGLQTNKKTQRTDSQFNGNGLGVSIPPLTQFNLIDFYHWRGFVSFACIFCVVMYDIKNGFWGFINNAIDMNLTLNGIIVIAFDDAQKL